jgi:hypothetical protein
VYIADEVGYLKIWDLVPIIEKCGFPKASNYPLTKISFNPKRKENIDVTGIAKSFRNE